jgi:hypothetical protein
MYVVIITLNRFLYYFFEFNIYKFISFFVFISFISFLFSLRQMEFLLLYLILILQFCGIML